MICGSSPYCFPVIFYYIKKSLKYHNRKKDKKMAETIFILLRDLGGCLSFPQKRFWKSYRHRRAVEMNKFRKQLQEVRAAAKELEFLTVDPVVEAGQILKEGLSNAYYELKEEERKKITCTSSKNS